jgi:triosephosphate isomerase (TIM)
MSSGDAKTRPPLIVGNWKMHKNVRESLVYLDNLAPYLAKSQAEVGLAVPFTALIPVVQKVKEMGLLVHIGAQNISDYPEGAFTGEVSGEMIADVGATFVILGHSERRHFFREDDAYVNRKVKRAIKENLDVILCIGETLDERTADKVQVRLEQELNGSLEGLLEDHFKRICIAYEPIWAIGTGRVAKPEEAEQAHVYIRETIKNMVGQEVAEKTRILYGGSVKPDTAAALLAQPNIDGLLVGGASLSPQSFGSMLQ